MGIVYDSRQAKLGDIILFKGSGMAYKILSRVLQVFEPKWDRWGWHTAFVSDDSPWTNVVTICEAVGEGVQLSYLDLTKKDIRVYRWFDEEPRRYKVRNFVNAHLGLDYDVAIYFWTSIAVIFRHYWNRPIWKLLDRRFSCWELIQEFSADMGKPIVSPYDVVIITDLLKAIES